MGTAAPHWQSAGPLFLRFPKPQKPLKPGRAAGTERPGRGWFPQPASPEPEGAPGRFRGHQRGRRAARPVHPANPAGAAHKGGIHLENGGRIQYAKRKPCWRNSKTPSWDGYSAGMALVWRNIRADFRVKPPCLAKSPPQASGPRYLNKACMGGPIGSGTGFPVAGRMQP